MDENIKPCVHKSAVEAHNRNSSTREVEEREIQEQF